MARLPWQLPLCVHPQVVRHDGLLLQLWDRWRPRQGGSLESFFFPFIKINIILTSLQILKSSLFVVSAEIGDFDETQSWQHLLHNKYLPDQDAIRDKITECHRKHV